jgi:hypothetical protein
MRLRRIAAALLVAFMVLVVAVTPLSATTDRGYFELWLPSNGVEPGLVFRPHVVLFDDTGLVRAFVPDVAEDVRDGVHPSAGMTSVLHVSWVGGCGDTLIQLHLYPRSDGFELDERTQDNGCPFLIGISRSLTLLLSTPIDAASVRLVGPDIRAGD